MEFTLKNFDYSEVKSEENVDSQIYEECIDVMHFSDSSNVSEITESVLIWIAGYVAFKIQNLIQCSDCISSLSNAESNVTCVRSTSLCYTWSSV